MGIFDKIFGGDEERPHAEKVGYGSGMSKEGQGQADRYQQKGDAAQGRQGAQLDQGGMNAERDTTRGAEDKMGAAYGMGQQMATGESKQAKALLGASTDNMANILASSAASAGGGPGAQMAALRGSQGAVTQARTQAANEAIGAQERQNQFGANLMAGQANALGQQGLAQQGMQFQAANANLGSNMQQRELNDRYSMGMEGMGQNVYQSQMQADTARMQADMGAAMQRAGDETGFAGKIMGGGMEAGGSMLSSAMKAKGGNVSGKQPYLVGEEGPELIIPKEDGFVLTAQQTKAILGKSAKKHNLAAGGILGSSSDVGTAPTALADGGDLTRRLKKEVEVAQALRDAESMKGDILKGLSSEGPSTKFEVFPARASGGPVSSGGFTYAHGPDAGGVNEGFGPMPVPKAFLDPSPVFQYSHKTKSHSHDDDLEPEVYKHEGIIPRRAEGGPVEAKSMDLGAFDMRDPMADDPLSNPPELSPSRQHNQTVGNHEWLQSMGTVSSPVKDSDYNVVFGDDGPSLVKAQEQPSVVAVVESGKAGKGSPTSNLAVAMPGSSEFSGAMKDRELSDKIKAGTYKSGDADKSEKQLRADRMEGPTTFENVEKKPGFLSILGQGLAKGVTSAGRNLGGRPVSAAEQAPEQDSLQAKLHNDPNAVMVAPKVVKVPARAAGGPVDGSSMSLSAALKRSYKKGVGC